MKKFSVRQYVTYTRANRVGSTPVRGAIARVWRTGDLWDRYEPQLGTAEVDTYEISYHVCTDPEASLAQRLLVSSAHAVEGELELLDERPCRFARCMCS
jgi:hypothetical protein